MGELLIHGGNCLQAAREAHQVSTKTEASTLSGRHTDRRGDQVQDGEDRRGNEGECGDFIKRQALARDEDSSASYDEALN